jgi:hypothetical protein
MFAFAAALALFRGVDIAADVAIWAVDPHDKVFRDTPPAETANVVKLRAARNEYEPGQFAFRSQQALRDVSVEVTELVHTSAAAKIGDEAIQCNFVGFIPLQKNTPRSELLHVRAAPCEVPDPLLDAPTIDVQANSTQPVWVTVRVPAEAKPGEYRGEITLVTDNLRKVLPIDLTVDPFTLPEERHLLVTNWFRVSSIADAHGVELWSESFWQILNRYAQNLAAHRQNVTLVPWTLVEITREPNGSFSYDYGRFDRFVELFEKAGAADCIEISHVGHFGTGGWSGKEIVLRKATATERNNGERLSLEPDQGLLPFLADLQRHLDERGWLEKSVIHVADEPSINNVQSWREASRIVHQAAPRLRRIDAIEGTDFSGALEVWVPKLSHFDRWRDAYDARRGYGEFWYYVCCHPYGNVYPNRFLDYPTTCVRVLHWINFAADLSGYLHWGLNSWGDEPFGTPREQLPPGDTHAIYPGTEGPLNSIRWEIQRESLEDFEYLHLLTVKTDRLKQTLGPAADWIDPARRAKELCRRVVPAISNTETDPVRIMATRAAVADEIIKLEQAPMLLVQTEPPAGSTLVDGPILVEVRGVVQPAAVVRVNARPVEVRPDGTFACGTSPTGREYTITVEAEYEGNRELAARRFRLRNE